MIIEDFYRGRPPRMYQTTAPTLRVDRLGLLVLVTKRLINMPSKSMNDTSLNIKTMETSQKWTLPHSQSLTWLWEDFLASHSPSPVNVVGSVIRAVHSSLRSHGLLKPNSHAFYCLRTSKGYYLTTKELRPTQSSPRLMSWGTTSNGKCLTARITESPRTGSVCSLSDILEEHPDPKYFLSQAVTQSILSRMHKGTTLHTRSSAGTSIEEVT